MEIDAYAARPVAAALRAFLGSGHPHDRPDWRLIRALLTATTLEELTKGDDIPLIAWPRESEQRAALASVGDRLIYATVSSEDFVHVYRRRDVISVTGGDIINDNGDEFTWLTRRWTVTLPDRAIEVSGLSGWAVHEDVSRFMLSLLD